MPIPKVCVLDDAEVKEWRDDRIHPNCSNHKHINQKLAVSWVNGFEREGRYKPKAVPVGKGAIMLINTKVWSVLPSGDVRAYQFTTDHHGHRGDYRKGIGACGARDMTARMSVEAINGGKRETKDHMSLSGQGREGDYSLRGPSGEGIVQSAKMGRESI